MTEAPIPIKAWILRRHGIPSVVRRSVKRCRPTSATSPTSTCDAAIRARRKRSDAAPGWAGVPGSLAAKRKAKSSTPKGSGTASWRQAKGDAK